MVGIVVANSLFALIGIVGLMIQSLTGPMSPLVAFGVIMWILLGPGLLVRRPFTWRVCRTLIYAYAMGLALLVVFAILQGALFTHPISNLLELLTVVYLIGVRGYLNSPLARDFYAVDLRPA